jgi:phosphate starvation-inducible protein PhoH
MEKLGIVRHSTKKYYRKVYDTISDWMEKDAIPKIRRMETSVIELDTATATTS